MYKKKRDNIDKIVILKTAFIGPIFACSRVGLKKNGNTHSKKFWFLISIKIVYKILCTLCLDISKCCYSWALLVILEVNRLSEYFDMLKV